MASGEAEKRSEKMRPIPRRRSAATVAAAVAACIGLAVTGAFAGTRSPDGTSGHSGEVDVSSSRPHNVTLVETALQVVFNEHRVDQIDRYFSADFVQHSPLVADAGREGLKQWLARTVEAIPDLAYDSTQVLVDRDRVITFSTVTGTIQRDLPEYGIKANGQQLNVATAHIFRVADGMIAEHWEVVDTGPLVRFAYESLGT
jgi:predicted SnoaL-like aldol condensation-catalyzing enzyme